MYVYVLSCKGTMLAHGVNEKWVGEDFIDLKDAEGKFFIKEIVDTEIPRATAGWITSGSSHRQERCCPKSLTSKRSKM